MDQFDDEKYRRQSDRYFEDYTGISELCKLFHSMVKLWKNYENRDQILNDIVNNKDSMYRISMSMDECVQISSDFYKSIGLESKYQGILNGESGIEVNFGKTSSGNNIWSSGLQQIGDFEYVLNVTDHNSIETSFIIVHEFMHAITMYDEFNESKYLLREVCPHIVELLFSDFLFRNKEKYGFNDDGLLYDLRLTKFMRFLNYYDRTNRCLRQDYIIALLANTQLEKKPFFEKRTILINLLDVLDKDNIIESLEVLQLRLNRKSNNRRQKYVNEMFDFFTDLFSCITSYQKTIKK